MADVRPPRTRARLHLVCLFVFLVSGDLDFPAVVLKDSESGATLSFRNPLDIHEKLRPASAIQFSAVSSVSQPHTVVVVVVFYLLLLFFLLFFCILHVLFVVLLVVVLVIFVVRVVLLLVPLVVVLFSCCCFSVVPLFVVLLLVLNLVVFPVVLPVVVVASQPSSKTHQLQSSAL